MISWNNRGNFNDANVPHIDDKRLLTMGVRVSAPIDVSSALAEIGKIRSGRISYLGRPINATEIVIFASMDDGQTWDRILSDGYIPDAERLNDHPSLKLKYVIKSYLSTIQPDYTPRLYQVCIELSNQKQGQWDGDKTRKLYWRGIE